MNKSKDNWKRVGINLAMAAFFTYGMATVPIITTTVAAIDYCIKQSQKIGLNPRGITVQTVIYKLFETITVLPKTLQKHDAQNAKNKYVGFLNESGDHDSFKNAINNLEKKGFILNNTVFCTSNKDVYKFLENNITEEGVQESIFDLAFDVDNIFEAEKKLKFLESLKKKSKNLENPKDYGEMTSLFSNHEINQIKSKEIDNLKNDLKKITKAANKMKITKLKNKIVAMGDNLDIEKIKKDDRIDNKELTKLIKNKLFGENGYNYVVVDFLDGYAQKWKLSDNTVLKNLGKAIDKIKQLLNKAIPLVEKAIEDKTGGYDFKFTKNERQYAISNKDGETILFNEEMMNRMKADKNLRALSDFREWKNQQVVQYKDNI